MDVIARVRITVVIPTYRSRNYINKCVTSILKVFNDVVTEIIIVDNSEPQWIINDNDIDPTSRNLTKIIYTGANLGFRKAVNIGIENAHNEIILVSNPDVVFPALPIYCLEAIAQDDKIGCSFPLIIHPNKNLNIIHTKIAVPFLISYAEYMTNDVNVNNIRVYVERFSGACFFLRRDIFKKVGEFENTNMLYLEEDELSMKLVSAGYKICFCPRDKVLHIGGHSIENSKDEFFATKLAETAPYLYRRFSSDGFSRKFLWWFLYLLETMQFSIYLRNDKPIKIALYLLFHKPGNIKGSDYVPTERFWNIVAYLLEKKRYIKYRFSNL